MQLQHKIHSLPLLHLGKANFTAQNIKTELSRLAQKLSLHTVNLPVDSCEESILLAALQGQCPPKVHIEKESTSNPHGNQTPIVTMDHTGKHADK